MRRFVWLAVLLVGCSNELRPGRCNQTSDCAGGLVCDLSPTPQGNGRCVATDAGQSDGDSGVGDVGVDTGPECIRHTDCPNERPACSSSGTCVGCDVVANSCVSRGPGKPACAPSGLCVECVSDSACSSDVTKPICDTTMNACVACSSDAQCAAKLGPDPGVCMSHQNGRCATMAEAIFVQASAVCASTPGASAGSPEMPFCSVQPAVLAFSNDRRLIVVRGTVQATSFVLQPASNSPQITFVGQQDGAIAGGGFSALALDGASVLARDLTFKLSAAPAIIARNSSVLVLQHVVVDNNPGGGVLVDGAGFDIRNTTITRNGPTTTGPTTWGGVLVQNLSSVSLRTIDLVTIQNNGGPGLSCSDRIDGSGILASDNAASNIGTTCQATACSPPGADCGAQP